MDKSQNIDKNRRDFVKKAAYTAPAIVTLAALPSFASAGSGMTSKDGGIRRHRKRRHRRIKH